jgi:hypothetical protein
MYETSRQSSDALLTLDKVAVMAKVDLGTVQAAVRDRKLMAQQKQGEWLATVADVRKWIGRR